MIAEGSSNRCIWWWTQHLESEVNEKVEIKQSRGLRGETIRDMLEEMQKLAAGSECENFFYELHLNPAPGELLTDEQWEQARLKAEKAHGFEGQPFFEVRHTKVGKAGHTHEHPHYIYFRVSLETGLTISDSFDARTNHAIAREIEKELGLQKVIGPYDREPGTPRPKRAPKRWESYRADQSGISIEDIEAEIAPLRQESENGQEFKAALESHGYILARGDRKTGGEFTLMIIDPAGDDHSLARRLKGVTTKQLNEFMRDVDREALPSITQAQQMQEDRKIAALEAERDRYHQAWEQAVMNAAIEQEKAERKFIAPEDRQQNQQPEKETRAAAQWEITATESEKLAAIIAEGQKRQAAEQERQAARAPKPKPAAPELGRVDAGIRLAYSLTGTGQEFADAVEDRGVIAARMTEADAARLNKWERQRLKELKELQDALALASPAPIAENLSQDEKRFLRKLGKNPPARQQEPTPADAWMAQTGGFENLPPELQEKAEASYEKWNGPKEKYGLENYVDYVQTREAERREKQQPGQQRPYEKYKRGELVIVDQWSRIHQLNYRNTGDSAEDRAKRLQDIDTAPLMSVADAESVMKTLSAHRQEERRQIWEQKRQEALRVRQEQHWPTLPVQPEHKSAVLFNQAATEAARDERTENLSGPAAQTFEAWRQTGSDKAKAAELAALYGNKNVSLPSPTKEEFAATLDDRGITFARTSKEEANRSHREAELARAADNYAPRFKEGEIVIVIEARPEWNAEPHRRVYKLDQSIAEKFVTRLDIADRLQSIEATLRVSDERQQLRREERTTARTERATEIYDRAPARAGKGADMPAAIRKAPARVIGGAFNIGVELAGLFFSFIDAPKSPRQQARDNLEGERLTERRNAEAEVKIDFSKYTSDQAQEKRNHQEQQAARDRQREIERERF